MRLPPRQALLLSLLAIPGCASQDAAKRVAVMPLEAIGTQAQVVGKQVRRSIGGELERAGVEQIKPARRVEETMKKLTDCEERTRSAREGCATATGKLIGATHVVAGAVGGLGKTYVLELQVIDVERKAVTRSLEETLFGGRSAVDSAVAPLTRRLFDLRRKRAWYTRWWFWTAVAGAVAAATVAVVVPLTLREDDPYVDVPLP